MPYKDKTCLNCEAVFSPQTASQKYCRKTITSTCPECEKTVGNVCTFPKTMRIFCSQKCSSKSPILVKKREEAILKKYGVKNIMQVEEVKKKILDQQRAQNGGKLAFNTAKQKQTMTERYGGPSPMYSKELRKKVEKTQRENNGGVFAFNTPKQKETMLERYGSAGLLGNPEKYAEHEKTMLERYGYRKVSQDPEFHKRIMEKIVERHGALFGNRTISKINKKFAESLKQQGIEVSFEETIGRRSFDLFYAPTKLLIDINPTITHNSTLSFRCLKDKCSEQPCNKHKPTDKSYHYERALLAKNNGYELVQIYDWDQSEELISIIKAKSGTDSEKLRASKLEVRLLFQSQANKFLRENHYQSSSKAQTHCYGLLRNDEILAVMTFSKSRFNKNYEYELNRFSTKKGYQIYGGASRLFKRFIKEVLPESVISYMNFNHSTNPKTYLHALGFKEQETTGPDLIWSKLRTPKIVKQTSLNKIGADRLLKTEYGSDYSNEEIMLLEGYVKIYTAGNRVFSWKKKE